MTNTTVRTRYLLLIAALAVFAAAFLWACPSSEERAARIRIGYTPVTGNLALFAGVEQGIFEKHGLEVAIQDFQNANLHTQALLAGQIDGSATIPITTALLVEPQERGALKLLVVNIYPRQNAADALVVGKDSAIASIADLKGARIGIIPDVSAQEFVKAMVASELDPNKDVEIIQIPVQNQVDALASGQVDALWALEPLVTIAVERGVAKILEEGAMAKHIHDPMVTAAFTLSTNFIDAHPDQAQAYKTALLEASRWIAEHPDEARAILPKYTNISPELAPKVRLVEYEDAKEVLDDINFLSSWMLDRGILRSPVDPEPMVY